MTDRIDALAYWLERQYGRKVPQCPRCKSEFLHELHHRASRHCDGCGWEISNEVLSWVPADRRARRPEEQ